MTCAVAPSKPFILRGCKHTFCHQCLSTWVGLFLFRLFCLLFGLLSCAFLSMLIYSSLSVCLSLLLCLSVCLFFSVCLSVCLSVSPFLSPQISSSLKEALSSDLACPSCGVIMATSDIQGMTHSLDPRSLAFRSRSSDTTSSHLSLPVPLHPLHSILKGYSASTDSGWSHHVTLFIPFIVKANLHLLITA